MAKQLTIFLVMMLSIIPVFSQEPTPTASGIYYGGVKLGTSRITGERLGNLVGAYLTYGLSGAKRDMQIEGKTAEITIDEKRPVFSVVFAENSVPAVFQDPANADRLILVKLKQGKKERKLQNGSYGLSGIESDVASKYIIPMKVEQVSATTFTFTPKEDLKKGEYGFYFKMPKLPKNDVENVPESSKPYNCVIDFTIK